jgi:hypothetical protein
MSLSHHTRARTAVLIVLGNGERDRGYRTCCHHNRLQILDNASDNDYGPTNSDRHALFLSMWHHLCFCVELPRRRMFLSRYGLPGTAMCVMLGRGECNLRFARCFGVFKLSDRTQRSDWDDHCQTNSDRAMFRSMLFNSFGDENLLRRSLFLFSCLGSRRTVSFLLVGHE